MRKALTYDDISLVPSMSTINTRSNIDLKTRISRRYGLLNPIIASPMDTICEFEMAFKLFLLGGAGCIHRFMSIEEQCKQVRLLRKQIYEDWGVQLDTWHTEISEVPIVAAIGVQEDDRKRAFMLTENGANVLIIDVAHGHHTNVIDMIKWCKNNLSNKIDIIAGNIVTAQAAVDLESAGADGLRVGIGNGCFTPNMIVKTNTGFKKIKDIKIGDQVYTHTGELKTVYNTFVYDNLDEIIDIDGIEATPNHKFYVIHQSNIDLVNDNNIEEYAEWVKAKDLNDEYFLVELD